MYRSRPGSETRKNERLARTRKTIKMSGANLFAAAHFYCLTCESNEHREEAERIRGGVRVIVRFYFTVFLRNIEKQQRDWEKQQNREKKEVL